MKESNVPLKADYSLLGLTIPFVGNPATTSYECLSTISLDRTLSGILIGPFPIPLPNDNGNIYSGRSTLHTLDKQYNEPQIG